MEGRPPSPPLLPMELAIQVVPDPLTGQEPTQHTFLLSSDTTNYTELLQACMEPTADGQPPAAFQAHVELQRNTEAYLVSNPDVPVASTLARLPKLPAKVVFTLLPTDHPLASPGASCWGQTLRNAAVKTMVFCIKTIVVLEAGRLVLQRGRLLRYLGRRERWGPTSSDSLFSGSSDDETVGTSTEIADTVLDYLAGEEEPGVLAEWTPQQVARGLRKIHESDLDELGLDESAADTLAQLRAAAARLEADPEGAALGQGAQSSGAQG